MLSSIKRFNLFATPLIRRNSTIVSQWCGLIKLPYIPLDGLNHKLNGKDAVILIDNMLYFAEQKNKKLHLIKESGTNILDYRQLKSKCNEAWRSATTDEIHLIQRLLSPTPPAREEEKQSDSYSSRTYSSTSSSGEVDYAYAIAEEERRKKEFYRNYLIFDTLTDSNSSEIKSNSQENESKQPVGYSNDSNHSSSDTYDSSNDSSSYNSGPSCGGGSSYDD